MPEKPPPFAHPVDDEAAAWDEIAAAMPWRSTPTEAFAPAAQAFAADGTVVIDLACSGCGYNLRGLTAEHSCPECGLDVATSAKRGRLRFADPVYLSAIQRGAKSILIWALLLVVVFVLAFIGFAVGTRTAYTGTGATGLLTVGGLFLGVALGAGVCWMLGVWWITTPDPSGMGEFEYRGWREWSRRLLLISLGLIALSVLLVLALSLTAATGYVLQPLVYVINLSNFVQQLLWVAIEFTLVSYLGAFALRIPREDLRQRANVIRFGRLGVYGVGVLFIGVMTIAMLSGGPQGPRDGCGLIFIVGLLGVLWLVFYLMFLSLVYEIGQAAREAHSALGGVKPGLDEFDQDPRPTVPAPPRPTPQPRADRPPPKPVEPL